MKFKRPSRAMLRLHLNPPTEADWHASHTCTHLGYLSATAAGVHSLSTICAALVVVVWLAHAIQVRKWPAL